MSLSFFGILVFACVLNAIYLGRCWRLQKTPGLPDAIVLIVTAAGMVGAIKLVARLAIIAGSDDDRLCVFVGAVSLFWVSVQAVLDVYKK